jgi:hypothetical protein
MERSSQVTRSNAFIDTQPDRISDWASAWRLASSKTALPELPPFRYVEKLK